MAFGRNRVIGRGRTYVKLRNFGWCIKHFVNPSWSVSSSAEALLGSSRRAAQEMSWMVGST